MNKGINDIIALLLQTEGTNISIYDEDFLIKSLDKRLITTGNDSYINYFEYLKEHKKESGILLDSMLIAFSEFFRNPLTFAVLEQNILPAVIEKKKTRSEHEIRIWSAACAAGQEAYSLAIVLDELMENLNKNLTCRIFATDIDETELSNAQKGIYQMTSINKVPYKRIQKYFTQKGDNYIIAPRLRKYIDFSAFNLLSQHGESPPASIYGDFDIIFCSNVLFYYKPEVQVRILERLSNNLIPGGYLITGEVERKIVKGNKFCEVYANSSIFQKVKY